MTPHHHARIAVIGLATAVALGVGAAPAYAADTDLGVELTGTTFAAGADNKILTAVITNHGASKPGKAAIVFDATGLDTSKVAADTSGLCKLTNEVARCELPAHLIPAPGQSVEQIIILARRPGMSGAAGTLSMTITVAGDGNRANDSATADVRIAGSNPDVLVLAEDVTAAGPSGDPTGEPVAPGAIGSLAVVIVNQGDMTAAGAKIHVRLPRQTTFAHDVDGCERSIGDTVLTCVLDDVALIPLDINEGIEDIEDSFLLSEFPVRVAPDAKGPVALQGGEVTAVALDRQPHTTRRTEAAGALPKGFSRPTAAQIAAIDADPTDNTDGFAVLVADATNGSGHVDGGAAGGGVIPGGGQAGGAQDQALPVTGPAVFTLGGTGVAVVALGTLLLASSRRRRVIPIGPRNDR